MLLLGWGEEGVHLGRVRKAGRPSPKMNFSLKMACFVEF